MTSPLAWQPLGLSGGGGTFHPVVSPHDPDLMLLQCDMSGAYRSDDAGRSWSLLPWHQLTGCPFCAPAFHPRDHDTVFAAYSYAATLRVSRDRGRTFAPLGRGLPGDLRVIAIDPQHPQRMIVAARSGLFRSLDGGQNWASVLALDADGPGQDDPTHVIFDRAPGEPDRRVVIVVSRRSVRRSDDGGKTWPAAIFPTRATLPSASSPEPSHPGASPVGSGLIVSAASVFDPAAGGTMLFTWVYPPEALAAQRPASASTLLLRSRDLGASWQAASTIDVPAGWGTHGYHFLLACDRDPARLYAVLPLNLLRGTVLRSDDRGGTWRNIHVGDKSDPALNMPVTYCTTYFLPKSLVGWAVTNAFIDPRNPDRIGFAHYCHNHQTRDGGATWESFDTRVVPGHPPMGDWRLLPRFSWVNNGLVITTTWNYYVDPFDRARHTIAYTDLGMAQTLDAGKTWVWRRDTGPNTYEMAWDPHVPGRVWAALSLVHDIPNNNIVLGGHGDGGGSGCIGFSEDHGQTWSGRNAGLPGGDAATRSYDGSIPTRVDFPVTSIILDPSSPKDRRTLFASLFGQGVWRSRDGGLSWQIASAGLGVQGPGGNRRVCRIKLHPDGTLLCLITGLLVQGRLARPGVGLYRSRDQGDSWQEITSALDIHWACDFDLDPRDSAVIYLGASDDTPAGREDGGLFMTTDAGKTWRRAAHKSQRHFGATVDPDHPDIVYMTLNYNDASVPALWVSRDRGESWAPVEAFPFCSAHRVAFDPFDPGVIYVTTYGASVWRGPRVRPG